MGHRARRPADLPVLIGATSVASITDVARLAGVSPATVSRVVSSAPYAVSPATRARVLEAARTLDYVPNALARGLLKSTIPVVGVVVHDITDPYFSEVVRGVEDAATPGGYLVITCSSDRIAERENSYVRLLRSMRAATLIFAGSGLDDPVANAEMAKHITAMRGYGAAVVHLSPHASGQPEVGVDNVGGIAAMIAELVRLGHRQIAFLAGPAALYVARQRLAGYRRGLAEAGIPFDERLVVSTGFNREAAPSASTRSSPGRRRSPRSSLPTTCSRWACWSGWRRSASRSRARSRSRASTTSRRPRWRRRGCRPSGCRCSEIGRRGFAFAERLLAGEPRRAGRSCRPSSSCASRPPPPPAIRAAARPRTPTGAPAVAA